MKLSIHGEKRRVYYRNFLSWDIGEEKDKEPSLRFRDTPGGHVVIEMSETRHMTLNGDFRLTLSMNGSELAALVYLTSLDPKKRGRILSRLRAPQPKLPLQDGLKMLARFRQARIPR